jgi:hypothetical protein
VRHRTSEQWIDGELRLGVPLIRYRLMKQPKAFLTHASEDKSRFVIPFAKALLDRGVDVWLDKWEIRPGDSLVRKIFDEGLDSADAVIVVVSAASISKPWVREELDASVVARIEKGMRVIPVVLEESDVPAPLRHTLWISVPDPSDFVSAVDQIVETLYGRAIKPQVAPPPLFAATSPAIPNRTTQQAAVLKIFCDLALEAKDRFGLMTDEAITRGEALGLTSDQMLDGATALVELHDLEPSPVASEIPPHYSVTSHGFIRCVSERLPEYKDVYHAIASALINEKKSTNDEVASAVGANLLLVEQILELMAEKRLIHLEKCIGRHWYISNVSPRLKDVLAGA